METIKTAICIIGGGSGGLSVAAAASQMGQSVVLCEGHLMGGDCLNTGCIPSKALLASAKTFGVIEKADRFGIKEASAKVDFSAINHHINTVIDTIAPHDSVSRFAQLGVRVIEASAHFIDKATVQAGNCIIKAKHIIIATGSRAMKVAIPGIDNVDYLTNETLFKLTSRPRHLVIIGGGPIGCEIAEAYALLGCKVSIIEVAPTLLATADGDCRSILKQHLIDLGVTVMEGQSVLLLSQLKDEISIKFTDKTLTASHLLLATGRTPNIDTLALDKAGIHYHAKGIHVDKRLRTNQKHIYAIGDVAGAYQFTHAAAYHASVVIQNLLFKLPVKVNYGAFPWVIYTSLELAHVGLPIQQAEKQGATILMAHYQGNDRAQTDHHQKGLIKVAVTKRGTILGVSLVGQHAGELLTPWTLAIQNKLKIKHVASLIVPYPTLSELNKRVAGSFYTPKLYSAFTKKLIRFLAAIYPFA